MITVAAIVEGQTEVYALPHLLRRMVADLGVYDVEMPQPFRLARLGFTNPAAMGRAVAFAAARVGDRGSVLAFADSDDDCAVEFTRSVYAAAGRPDVRLSVVAAVREFESLFLAASTSLPAAGYFSAPFDADAERVRDAAGAVGRLMVSGQYQKTADAIRLLSALSLEEARKRRWYRKLESDLARVLDV